LLYDVEFAGRGLVEAGALEIGKLLGEHTLRRGHDQAGDLAPGFFEHLFVFEFDGPLRLDEKIAGPLGGDLMFAVGVLFGRLRTSSTIFAASACAFWSTCMVSA